MLVDIDKTNPDRYNPSPNTHDVLASNAIMAKGTNSVNYVTPGTNQSIVSGAKSGQFTNVSSTQTDPTTSATVVSAPSGYATGKVVFFTIPHNLPYIPAITAFVFIGGAYYPCPYIQFSAGGTASAFETVTCSVDATNVYFYIDSLAGNNTIIAAGGQLQFKYYLSQQTAN